MVFLRWTLLSSARKTRLFLMIPSLPRVFPRGPFEDSKQILKKNARFYWVKFFFFAGRFVESKMVFFSFWRFSRIDKTGSRAGELFPAGRKRSKVGRVNWPPPLRKTRPENRRDNERLPDIQIGRPISKLRPALLTVYWIDWWDGV